MKKRMTFLLALLLIPCAAFAATFGDGSFVSGYGQTRSAYSAGTVYTLTATPAAVDFGTTDPVITLTQPGTWMIFGRAKVDYVGSTFAAVRAVTIKLRRTNNTAADLTSGTVVQSTNIITTLTYTMGEFVIPPIVYTTTNADDAITIFSDVAVLPTAGTITVSEASIVAVRIG